MSKLERYINLDNLPRVLQGTNKGRVDWSQSPGHKVKFKYSSVEGEIDIVSYYRKQRKIGVKYLDSEEFIIATDHFTNCKIGTLLTQSVDCKSDKYIRNTDYIYKVGDILESDNGKLEILELIRVKKGEGTARGYKYKCLKCGQIGERNEIKLKKSRECSVCGLVPKKIIKDVNSIFKTHPQLVKYFVNIEDTYTHASMSNKTVPLKCPICGLIRTDIAICRLNVWGFSCYKCGDGFSVPAKFMFNILNSLNIEFENEKLFDWCKFEYKNLERRGFYDFYFKLNNKEYIVEVDGGHHKTGRHKITAEDQNFIDNYKDKLAKEHNIKMIRIDSEFSEYDFILNNIIQSKLNDIFDLTKVDFKRCFDEAAGSSLVKKVCDMWNDSIEIVEIIKKLKLSENTIRKYLNIGNDIGWCRYNLMKTLKENGLIDSTKINLYDNNNIKIAEFKSIRDAVKQSKIFFGKTLTYSRVCQICVSKNNQVNNEYIMKFAV